jgi:hypothetical protein
MEIKFKLYGKKMKGTLIYQKGDLLLVRIFGNKEICVMEKEVIK